MKKLFRITKTDTWSKFYYHISKLGCYRILKEMFRITKRVHGLIYSLLLKVR
jgi:hypothetical protein